MANNIENNRITQSKIKREYWLPGVQNTDYEGVQNSALLETDKLMYDENNINLKKGPELTS